MTDRINKGISGHVIWPQAKLQGRVANHVSLSPAVVPLEMLIGFQNQTTGK